MMGYKDKPEKTLETIDEDGWVRSGDLGKLDKQGFFAVTGRIKELLITSGGENIPPFLIEDNIKVSCHIYGTLHVPVRLKTRVSRAED